MELLQPLFGSRMKLVEMIALLRGVKPVIRQSYDESQLPGLIRFCDEHGLHLVKSKFKVVPLDAEKNFSNKGLRVALKDPRKGQLFVYISKDELRANKAALWELRGNHFLLGRELGYPRCCCRFFNEHRHTQEQLDNDFELPVLASSPGETFSAVMNIFHRDKDACLLSHFPCSLNCEESSKIGSEILRVITAEDVKLGASIIDRLRGSQVVHGKVLQFF